MMKTAMQYKTDRQLIEEINDATMRSIPISLTIMAVISFIEFVAIIYLLTH